MESWKKMIIIASIMYGFSLSSSASVFYQFDEIARSGSGLFSIEDSPSINDKGSVAFIGKLTNSFRGNNAIFVGDGSDIPTNITPGYISSSIDFSRAIQLNNSSQVTAQHTSSGITLIRVWNGNLADNWTYIASGQFNNTGTDFDSVFSHPSINNNAEVVFSAIAGHGFFLSRDCPGTCLVTPNGTDDFHTIQSQTGLRPMIADDGSIVVGPAPFSNEAITVYSNDFSNPKIIADPGTFVQLGRSPGISDDGNVVAFVGDRGNGLGVFISVRNSTGFSEPILVAGENTGSIAPKVELGYDGDVDRIYLNQFDLDSRVGVIHMELGQAGASENSIVVSFIATPSAASRTNPTTQKPFAHTSQQGLWSVKVDADQPLTNLSPQGNGPITYHATSPLPVIQINDVIHSPFSQPFRVSGISIYDPLATAAYNVDGSSRVIQRGDHRLAFRVVNNSGETMVVRASHLDTDQDGLLDHWETQGIDSDQDGTTDLDLAALGANVSQRDIFLEIDWLEHFISIPDIGPAVFVDFAPQVEAIDFLVNMFSDAPNPITLHVDAGPGLSRNIGPDAEVNAELLRGGNKICSFDCNVAGSKHIDVVFFGHRQDSTFTSANLETRSFDNIKDQFFGTTDKRAREFAFHYVVFADMSAAKPNGLGAINGTDTGPLGISEGGFRNETDLHSILGNDIIISLQGKTDPLNFPAGFMQANVLAHELGHNLGLRHGGNDDVTTFSPEDPEFQFGDYKPEYVSIMNYSYTQSLMGSVVATGGISDDLVAADSYFQGASGLIPILSGLNTLIFDGPNRGSLYWQILNNTTNTLNLLSPFAPASPLFDLSDKFAIVVRDYSRVDDPVFNDWANIKLDFSNYADFLGNSFNKGRFLLSSGSQTPESTIKQIEDRLGPLDSGAPYVTIDSPLANEEIPIGVDILVRLTADDDFGVNAIEVSFDVNGDGSIITAEETLMASLAGINTYQTIFSNISGVSGLRNIVVNAKDISSRVTTIQQSVEVVDALIVDVPVPNVIGQSQASAEEAIVSTGLIIGSISFQHDTAVPMGNVVSQSLPPGTEIALGSAIDLLVSLGPTMVSVPNLRDMKLDEAEATLLLRGLGLGAVNWQYSISIPLGNVISQEPANGENVIENSLVDLVLSLGPAIAVEGDLDEDGDIDKNDIAIVFLSRNAPSSGPDDSRDLDNDGYITIGDARILVLRCTRPSCAAE